MGLPGKAFNVRVSAGVVALHQFGNASQIENAGVHDYIAPGPTVVADNDAVVLAEPAFDVVKRTFATVGRFAEHLGIVGVHHVQGEQHQVFPVRAFGGHRL